ncbi:MAG: glutathione-disulfide reductase [Gammaproteobacteria bacterium]|nr:glutathione-disulfide reductase [Gammaproteobacteria bacterium]
MQYDYDLYVIGAGSGGVRAARISAGYGAKVAVAESTFLGGTCVNVGCVPKKLFVYGSHFHEEFEDAAGFGWTVDAKKFDWSVLRDNKTAEIERLNDIYRGLLSSAGVDLHEGKATFVDTHTISLNGTQYTAEKILIATGGWAVVPEFPGNEHVITSNEAFYLPSFPNKVVIVGGGYIAVEFAGIFAGLGADTTLVYRGPLFLRNFDDSIRNFIKDELPKKGVKLKFETQVEAIERQGDTRRLVFADGNTMDADLVLYATGRKPNTANLNLESVGIELGRNSEVLVNDEYQTNVPNIYAIGDVTDRIQLTPVAIEEGMCIANDLFTDKPKKHMNYNNIPTAVFCQPNIGTVGLTESQALEQHAGDLVIFESDFKPMKHTLSKRDERTFMKMIVRRSDDVVIGIHMVGPDAGEIVQGLAVAMIAGATKAQFDATVGIHPTAAEELVTMREYSREV